MPAAIYTTGMFSRIFTLGLIFFAVGQSTFALPHWIWHSDREPTGRADLHHTFNAPAKLKSAQLRIIADFANVQLYINSKPATIAEMFGPVIKLNAKPWLRTGKNEISLRSISLLEKPAVALELVMIDESDKETIVTTSPEWSDAKSLGDLGLEKWWNVPTLVIDETDDYTQWKRASNAKAGTDPASFEMLPGYKVELLRSAGKDENSWVSLAFDPDGRLTVAREDKGLIRFTLSNDHKMIIKTESINDDLKECRGLLYAHGSLYVNANNSKGLYRLQDTNGNGKFDKKELLHASAGGVGHGRNDLALGPDGMIYAIHGDSVLLPEDIPDRTSPLRKNFPPFRKGEGHVLRMGPDGSSKEIFCAGMRNPYGIAFNADGEAFTYDADAEFDMGTPWYRPTQVKHLTSGADFGWRAVTGSWPSYFPDHPNNTQPTLNIGKGSPTGVKFGTKSNFPPDYQKALYILDWTYGRILAVHLRPRGSTYMGAAEVFLRGQPLNVTDLGFGPDGAMYFVTGGRKTQSALYRVTYTGPHTQPRPLTRAESNRAKRSKAFRKERKKAEFHHCQAKFVFELDHLEPRIWHAWRIALEHNKLIPKKEDTPNFEYLNARANIDSITGKPRITLLDNWPKLLPSDQLAYLDLIHRIMDRHELPTKTLAAIQSNLEPQFPGHSPEVNQAIAPLLIRLNPTKAVAQTVELLDASVNQRERIYYLYHLRNAKVGWTPALRRTFFRILGTYDTFLGGRGLPQALQNIRRDALVTLTDAEKMKLTKVIKQKPTLPPLPDLTGRKIVKHWKLDDFNGALNFEATKRNLANGRKMFSIAMCNRCHRHGREGYPIGPDLTHVASRFGRRDLLSEILDPSKTIAENYQTSLLELKDGRQLAGQIIPNLDYRAPNLQLAENPLHPDKITKIPKADITKRSQSKISLMPPGLLNLLTREEVLDLLAWLQPAVK